MKMGSLKAPRPDAFIPIFFKETWNLTGRALHKFARDIMDGGEISLEAA